MQHRSNPDQVVEDRRLVALLDPVHRLTIQPGEFSDPLLRKALGPAGFTELVTELPAASENPVRRRGGRHPTTLAGS